MNIETTPDSMPAEETEIFDEAQFEKRREIMESASEERAGLLNSYLVSKIFNMAQTVVPGVDMESFIATANESTGAKKIRYNVAAGITGLYWNFAIQGKTGIGTAAATVLATGALRAPELAEMVLANPAIARFARASLEFLSDKKQILQETGIRLLEYVKKQASANG